MSDAQKTVCLLTAGHVSSTPRLVREAEALCAAGYRVHVVAGRSFRPADELDAALLPHARWTLERLDSLKGPAAALRKLQQRAARRLVRKAPFATPALAALAHYAGALAQARLAARLRADLYLGHQLAGLAMAAFAAREANAFLGFDLEDYHDAETVGAMNDPALSVSARIIQATFLPECSHLTAASPLIARQYEQVYGVKAATVLNVYPLADAPPAPVVPAPISADSPAVLTWFSQTVGPGRGLESVLRALALVRTPIELQLRGHVAPAYQAALLQLAGELRLARPPRFLPSAPPHELVRLVAGAHLGLSLEERTPLNRDLCLPNKNFAYVLAGLPQLLSATQAHTALAAELGEAALLGDLGEPAQVATLLDDYFADSARQTRARAAAWTLGQTRFNWEHERGAFLRPVQKLLK